MDATMIEAISEADALRRCHNGIGGVYLYLGHDGDNACTLKDFDAREVGKGTSGRSLLEAIGRAVADWRHRRALEKAADKRVGPIDESSPLGVCAADAVALHACLDDKGVPRVDSEGQVYSLWGRVTEYARLAKQ